MQLTDYHAKYCANELTKRCASDSVEKLASVLADAQVDLNPHQVDAALFAFRSPFSKGAILADEVGLGKTIEAGLLLAQNWAERKRRLLVVVPANLRKQWSQELADKFYLPSTILETKSFNEAVRSGKLNPFEQDTVIICSYQFARSKEAYLQQTAWNLVVIDEAHRLRNVYKTSSKIALAIKQGVAPFPKVLLTATPLQNTLLELYGLVSIIDDHAFGDLASYRARFARLGSDGDFAELKERLKPICKRTLRRQVLEYVKYTNRHALVQEFVPTEEEQRLYDLVSDYLQKPTLYALPASQRQLMTLILRKLLASSTYAISGTLDGLARKLEAAEAAATAIEAPPEELSTDWENIDELSDEWDAEKGESPQQETSRLTPEHLTELRQEMARLREFHALAKSIVRNSKGEVLLTALRRGFEIAAKAQQEQGAATLQQKAVIFTESRRTQDYLFRLLSQTEFAGKVMLFNGTNNDPTSKAIYQQWLKQHAGTDRVTGSPSADTRAALVENFRDHAPILIATEAAAEGINLQFCNLVVNYDMPWNPQRIEQRIGRCHRYGQKFDVVVVNFLNKKNAADKRVYDLLAEKFKLFSGVFGASDEVLGAIESGVDFEKRIASIYQKCRTTELIQFEFDQLQHELETDIAAGQRDAREKLLDNFDQEVVEKVRVDILIARRHHWAPEVVGFGLVKGGARRTTQVVKTPQSFGSMRRLSPFFATSDAPARIHIIDILHHTSSLTKLHPETNKAHALVCSWMERRLAPDRKKNSETRVPAKAVKQSLKATQIVDSPQHHQMDYLVRSKKQVIKAKKNEARLLIGYQRWLTRRGRNLATAKYGKLQCDGFERARCNLIEAKSSTSREHIRMAVGQLLDYAFQIEPKFGKPNMAILLPKEPDPNSVKWLPQRSISLIWREKTAFLDNANGQFT